MRQLVDDRLLEGHLVRAVRKQLVLERHLGARGTQRLAQLLGIEGVEVLVGDHES